MAHLKITQDKKQERYHHPLSFQTIGGVIHLTSITEEYLNQVKAIPIQEGDVFINTYPKSGTTWVTEIVWQIFFDGAEHAISILKKAIFLEEEKFRYEENNLEINVNEAYLKVPYPRLFKTHLPYFQAPVGDSLTKPKHIYVVRNPKDTAVSYYWHYKGFSIYEFDRSWDEFFVMFITGNVNYSSWFDHVLGWWARRDDPNILFLKYEDMKRNLAGTVQQIAKFLEKNISPELIERISKQTTFDAMSCSEGRFYDGDEFLITNKERVMDIKFMRKGEIGDWRNYFSEEQNKIFDALYERKMAGSELELEFD